MIDVRYFDWSKTTIRGAPRSCRYFFLDTWHSGRQHRISFLVVGSREGGGREHAYHKLLHVFPTNQPVSILVRMCERHLCTSECQKPWWTRRYHLHILRSSVVRNVHTASGCYNKGAPEAFTLCTLKHVFYSEDTKYVCVKTRCEVQPVGLLRERTHTAVETSVVALADLKWLNRAFLFVCCSSLQGFKQQRALAC